MPQDTLSSPSWQGPWTLQLGRSSGKEDTASLLGPYYSVPGAGQSITWQTQAVPPSIIVDGHINSESDFCLAEHAGPQSWRAGGRGDSPPLGPTVGPSSSSIPRQSADYLTPIPLSFILQRHRICISGKERGWCFSGLGPGSPQRMGSTGVSPPSGDAGATDKTQPQGASKVQRRGETPGLLPSFCPPASPQGLPMAEPSDMRAGDMMSEESVPWECPPEW